jgi:serine/threonine-protein kinase
MSDPETIGKYAIRSVLGRGAMGVVYRGFDPQIEREVAIKTVRKDLVDQDVAAQVMARFKNEARAAGRLLHPNIVTVYEYGEDGDTAFIAMEYVEGAGLREYLNRKVNLGVPQVMSIMSQLMRALQFAHDRGVVHRDIKPSNLILTPDGSLKVADFGIARIDTSNLTTVGMVVGTPAYMSPEQCQGVELDRRSDIFSAGVVLYELLTGEQPFSGVLEAIVYKICNKDPAPASALSKLALPVAIDAVIARALAKKADDRYPSATAFHRALAAALEGSSLLPEPADDRTRMGTLSVPVQPVPVPAFDDALLGTVERQLAQFVGPMAKVMVRKAATQAHDLAQLYSMLSRNIDTTPEREAFVGARREPGNTPTQARTSASAPSRVQPAPAVDARAPAAPTQALDQAYIDTAVSRLAVHLGPIAKVVARRAAQQVSTRHDFVRMLGEHLGTQERGAFLREMGLE